MASRHSASYLHTLARLLDRLPLLVAAPLYYASIRLRGWRAPCPPGRQRGCDFYPWHALPRVVARALADHRAGLGRLPGLGAPRDFNERMFRRKFLEPLALPVLADKLYLNRLVGAHLGRRHAAEVCAVAAVPEQLAPLLATLAPGDYFLKLSNGSHANRRFRVPADGLPPGTRDALVADARRWLDSRFGYAWGEWFYQTAPPAVYVERALCAGEPFDWRLFVVHGAVRLLRVTRNYYSGRGAYGCTFTPEWKLLAVSGTPPDDLAIPRPPNLAAMCALAVRVAALAEVDFVRVDLYDIDGRLVVGEATYIPGNGVVAGYEAPWFREMWPPTRRA